MLQTLTLMWTLKTRIVFLLKRGTISKTGKLAFIQYYLVFQMLFKSLIFHISLQQRKTFCKEKFLLVEDVGLCCIISEESQSLDLILIFPLSVSLCPLHPVLLFEGALQLINLESLQITNEVSSLQVFLRVGNRTVLSNTRALKFNRGIREPRKIRESAFKTVQQYYNT